MHFFSGPTIGLGFFYLTLCVEKRINSVLEIKKKSVNQRVTHISASIIVFIFAKYVLAPMTRVFSSPQSFLKLRGRLNRCLLLAILTKEVLKNVRNKGKTRPKDPAQGGVLPTAPPLFIENQSNGNEIDPFIAPLHAAIYLGHKEEVEDLIRGGADVNGVDFCGRKPLHIVAWIGNIESVQLLIESGAGVNDLDKFGLSPLHVAAFCGQLEVAKVLILHGANVNSLGVCNATPLHIAVFYRREQIINLLLENGAIDTISDSCGVVPFDFLSFNPYVKCKVTDCGIKKRTSRDWL